MTLGKVRRFRRPVVHLGVDIDRVLAFPRRRHQGIPDALQVCGLRSRARRGDQEIPAVLEIERREMRVFALEKLRWALVCGKLSGGGSPEVQFDAMKKSLVFAHVRGA